MKKVKKYGTHILMAEENEQKTVIDLKIKWLHNFIIKS